MWSGQPQPSWAAPNAHSHLPFDPGTSSPHPNLETISDLEKGEITPDFICAFAFFCFSAIVIPPLFAKSSHRAAQGVLFAECLHAATPPRLIKAALRHCFPTVFHDPPGHLNSTTRAPCRFAIIPLRGTPRPRLARAVLAGRSPLLLHRRRRY